MTKIGVLALQGDFNEHISMLKKCDVETKLIKLPMDLKEIDGLIIPGGESTTIAGLIDKYNLRNAIISKNKEGMPIFGTCAGTILLSKQDKDSDQPRLGLLDADVKRNEYGRQVDSFETELNIDKIGKFNGVFIRAPVIENPNGSDILSRYNNNPVLIRANNILAATFHPELTDDTRIHKYFLSMIKR